MATAAQPFCIVFSNYTAQVAAWAGTVKENRKYLGNRVVLAQVDAPDEDAALSQWRASKSDPCQAQAQP